MKEAVGDSRKRVAPLTVVLGIVFVFFCAVLVYVYAETKRINPVLLDEHGHPIGQSATPGTGGSKSSWRSATHVRYANWPAGGSGLRVPSQVTHSTSAAWVAQTCTRFSMKAERSRADRAFGNQRSIAVAWNSDSSQTQDRSGKSRMASTNCSHAGDTSAGGRNVVLVVRLAHRACLAEARGVVSAEVFFASMWRRPGIALVPAA